MLQQRVSRVRRGGATLAGRVAGYRADHQVRVVLTDPPQTACSCGAPLCRHAAALVQAYFNRGVAVVDVDRVVADFLAAPSQGVLREAALGSDLIEALQLPPEEVADLQALPEAQQLLQLDRALVVRRADRNWLMQVSAMVEDGGDRLLAWFGGAVVQQVATADWLALYASCGARVADCLAQAEPAAWPAACLLSLRAYAYQAAADADRAALDRLLALAARRLGAGDGFRLFDALLQHAGDRRLYLRLARQSRRLRYACRRLERLGEQPGVQPAPDLLALLREGTAGEPALQARYAVRQAAQSGSAARLRAARRQALRAGVWQRLRPQLPGWLAGRDDRDERLVELLLLDDLRDEAAAIADRCRSSWRPQLLMADALRPRSPAAALQRYRRAAELAARLGEQPALLEERIAATRASVGQTP